MPILIKKLDPSLTGPRKGVGVQIPFSSDSVFITNYSSEEAMKNNILHYLLTERGECYLNIERGFNLYGYLFEQNVEKTRQEISRDIESRLKSRFPRLSKVEVETNTGIDEHTLQILLKYRIEYSEKDSEVVLNIER